MEARLMESTVIIFCLCISVTTLGSIPDIMNGSTKPNNSKSLGHLHPWMKTRLIHQENDKNLLKQRTSTSIAHSENNFNTTKSQNLQANYKKNRKQDVHGIFLKEAALSQPKSMLTNNLSLGKGRVKRNTSNKSTKRSSVNQEITSDVNNITLFSTSGKGIIDGMVNVDQMSNKLTKLISVPQAGNNLPVNSEHISSLGKVIPDFTTLHGLNNNRGSLGGFGECCCHDTRCDFSTCLLTSVPQDLPIKTIELSLRNNDIKILPTNTFSRYIFLERLTLKDNAIFDLEEGAFNGLTLLTSLDLSGNLIGYNKNISTCIFEPLSSLKILWLNGNHFPCDSSRPPPDVFLASLRNLEELYIDNYSSGEYGPGFRNMTSLRNVTFYCGVCYLTYPLNTTFINLRHIKLLSIRNCHIYGPTIEKELFSHFSNLTTLDISQNPDINMEYLPVIMKNFQNGSLKTLIINNIVDKFSLSIITSNLTQSFPQTLTSLIARENNIISIDPNAVLMLPKSLKYIDLSDNYIVINPARLNLSVLYGLEVILLNSDSQTCFAEHTDGSDKNVWKYKQNKYTGTLKYEQIIENRQQLIKTVLPPNLKRVQINIKSSPNDFYYIDIDNNLEELDLSCSLLPEFHFDTLINLQSLRILNLGRSSLQRIYSTPYTSIPPIKVLILESNKLNDFLSQSGDHFLQFENLSYLDLTFNQLNSLDSNLLDGLDKLEYLRLDSNTFSHFDANISHMEQLKLLNISNTELSNLPLEVRSHIDHLCKDRPAQITVDMSGCPILCNCFNLDFLKWMVKSPAFNQNFTGYMCRYSDNSLKYVLDGYTEIIHDLERQCANNYPVFVLILAGTLLLFCAVTGTIIYRFRWKIRYLYYAAYLKIMDKKRKANKHEFKHDVFIAYDSEDQRFVRRYLAPELENRDLKLLIHTRDFVAGTYIASNIVMAVAESRKTLVVLTRNLLDSSWCNYEIQMATMEAVHTGRQVLVFLLKENIPNRELDVELLRYIKNNTYLPYPSPEDEGDEEIMKKFYDKLAHDLKC